MEELKSGAAWLLQIASDWAEGEETVRLSTNLYKVGRRGVCLTVDDLMNFMIRTYSEKFQQAPPITPPAPAAP